MEKFMNSNLQSISIRLRMVADLLCEKPGPISSFVDVGTDHAYLPIALVQEGIIPHAIAADVRKGPLEIARQHVQSFHLENCIETRLSDGFDQFQASELSHAAMAGMGGLLICSLCRRAYEKGLLNQCQTLILQPQSDTAQVREMLPQIGFKIDKEAFCLDRGKFYLAFRCVPMAPGEEAKVDRSYYSQALYHQRSADFRTYLEQEILKNQKILETIHQKEDENRSAETLDRIQELREKIQEAEDKLQNWN